MIIDVRDHAGYVRRVWNVISRCLTAGPGTQPRLSAMVSVRVCFGLCVSGTIRFSRLEAAVVYRVGVRYRAVPSLYSTVENSIHRTLKPFWFTRLSVCANTTETGAAWSSSCLLKRHDFYKTKAGLVYVTTPCSTTPSEFARRVTLNETLCRSIKLLHCTFWFGRLTGLT